MRKGKLRFVWLALGLLVLLSTGFLRERLESKNHAYGLSAFTSTQESPPAELGIVMSLGVFRSMLIDIIWMRAIKLQQEKRFYEIVQLYDLIGKLQPYSGKVWAHSAWNMAYNISVMLPPGEERWRWVNNGIDRIRFQGLKYNPDDRILYKEIAWIYSHKIGRNSDDSHLLYKTRLYESVEEVIAGYNGKISGVWDKLVSGTEDEKAVAQRIKAELKSKFNMELSFMKDIEDNPKYGPLDWRLPSTHCFYWAEEGLKRDASKMRDQDLQRLIYQSMQHLLKKGQVIYQPAIGNIPSRLMTLPDYRQAMPMLKMFLKQIEHFEQAKNLGSGVRKAFKFFMQEASEILTFAGEDKLAEEFFQLAKTSRPDIDFGAHTAKEFIENNLERRLKESSAKQYASYISATIMRHLFWKARNNKKKSAALLKRAKLLWDRNIKRNKSAERHINRNFKDMYETMTMAVFLRMMFHPDDLKRLESYIEPSLMKKIREERKKLEQAYLDQQKSKQGDRSNK